jgi:hypothetical protein
MSSLSRPGESFHGDEAISSQELGQIVGGYDFAGWDQGRLEKRITVLEMLIATNQRSGFNGSAKHQSEELYAAETELIKLVGGDYSPGAKLWEVK